MMGKFIAFIIFTANYNNNMRIFDFFKKKNNRQENVSTPVQYNEMPEEKVVEKVVEEVVETIPEVSAQPIEEVVISEQYKKIRIYNDYIMYSIALQLRGDLAPISAFEKENGEVEGFAYMVTEEGYTLSAEEVIERMTTKFESELEEGKIKSYMILYHSQFDNDGNHSLATRENEFKAITMAYHFEGENQDKMALPYVFENDNITYKGIVEFSHEENNDIMNTQLVEGKNYFTNMEPIKAPEVTNEAGIKIRKSNVPSLINTWSGIFGHDNFQNNPSYADRLITLLKECKANELDFEENKASKMEFADVKFKTLFNEEFGTIYPEIKTDFSLDFETKVISELENASNEEAIVAGPARDTFGVWFFATDYAEKREQYLVQPHLQINLSGIAFVLDVHQDFDLPDGTKMSEEFTTYMPSKDLPNYACFDFIGKVIDFKETVLFEDGSVKAYIVKLKLVTHEEREDFFTIDVFVHQDNMRFETLTKGMKVAGLLQLQGKIAE
ncbi:MAG: hypothetical protein RSN61_15095 [Chryseobacterium sp.]|uniref:hypothetical protein n=2 Tax=Chryseobacterium sp. TaxID=1871047 RepID=UPI002FC8833C